MDLKVTYKGATLILEWNIWRLKAYASATVLVGQIIIEEEDLSIETIERFTGSKTNRSRNDVNKQAKSKDRSKKQEYQVPGFKQRQPMGRYFSNRV